MEQYIIDEINAETFQKGKVYVNVYSVTQSKGGNEEGGWYYSVGSPEESIRVTSTEELEATLAKMRSRYAIAADSLSEYAHKGDWEHPDFDRRRNRGKKSAAGGYNMEIKVEDRMAQYFPQERPYYQ